MTKTLDELVAESASRALHIQYCRGMDRLDFELLRSCFHHDAVLDYGFYRGGIEGFLHIVDASLRGFVSTQHLTGNQLVRVDGTHAWAEHYTTSSHRSAADDSGPERDFIAIGRYIDELEQRDGDWRIAHRLLICDSSRTDLVTGSAIAPGAHRGTRDTSDPSYKL